MTGLIRFRALLRIECKPGVCARRKAQGAIVDLVREGGVGSQTTISKITHNKDCHGYGGEGCRTIVYFTHAEREKH